MLLQVERVVLRALGKNTALAADICASRESLAIVFRTSRSTMANKEQCPPMCTERKNLRRRTRLGAAVLAAANASTTMRHAVSHASSNAVACAVPSAFNSKNSAGDSGLYSASEWSQIGVRLA